MKIHNKFNFDCLDFDVYINDKFEQYNEYFKDIKDDYIDDKIAFMEEFD